MTQSTRPSNRALILIDIQNDYFDGFAFPLWQGQETLEHILQAVARAKATGLPILLVQHVADASKGPAPFFNQGTEGVAIHPRLMEAVGDAMIVQKQFADGFLETELGARLESLGAQELLIGGMMTQNCVTHTAISPLASDYDVTVLSDLSTSVSEMIHKIALNAIAPRVTITASTELF